MRRSGVVTVAKSYGVIWPNRDDINSKDIDNDALLEDQYIGIIMEDLRQYPGKFGIELNPS